ncbi:hypothetical protein D3C76_1858730 [compost metagenome]
MLVQAFKHQLGAHLALMLIHGRQMLQALGQVLGIAQREQNAHAFDHFLRAATRRCQQGHARRHGFE